MNFFLNDFLTLGLWVGVLLLMSFAQGMITRPAVATWYQFLYKSSLTPPSYVFGLVWTVLYVCIAVAGWLMWRERDAQKAPLLKQLYFLQLALNWLWTPLFFGYRQIGLALVCLSVTVVVVGVLVFVAYKKLPRAAYLLLPYFCWLLYAGYLNGVIWLSN